MTMPGVNKGYDRQWSDDNNSRGNSIIAIGREKKISNASSSQYSAGHGSDQMSDIDDGPTYLLEHLATFSVGRQQNIVDPTDGLNRLWQMEKRSGIWTQKMQMRLTKMWVVIIDYENGDVVEKFPMHLISSPMAYTGSDPNELYNNILIFIVKEDPKRKNLNPSEMHIFQCVQVPGQEIVKDLNLFISGKWKSGYKSELLPPPPTTPAPEPPINGSNGNMNHRRPFASPDMTHYRDSIDETSSTGSERYEKEVGILNHCFDDIEQFIAWLQSSAAAYRELERRRADRKSKKKDHGDGMLSMRAKPPPERDFVDVLQKFKLSFNLLAKLKAHIHDPNAPELVHFLFTPLALIVDASRESNYGPNLAAKVVSPLLTKEAVELLANCLTSKESDLWHSLGEAWVIPRDQWKNYVAPYHPTFRDGYSPEYPFNEEKERAMMTASAAAHVAQKIRQPEISKARQEPDVRVKGGYRSPYYDGDQDRASSPGYVVDRTQSPHSDHGRSDISTDSIERTLADPQKHVKQWLEELKMRDSKIVQVIFPRSANNEKELTVFRGEFLEVLDDGRKWWKARNIRGQIGHVPHTIVTPYSVDDDGVISNPLYDRNGGYKDDSDGSVSGERPPSRPPPIPPPAPAPADWVRQDRQGKKEVEEVKSPIKVEVKKIEEPKKPIPKPKEKPKEVHEDFNEELIRTISKGRQSRPVLGKVKLPPIYINEDSTAADIQTFLRVKKFDEGIQKTFQGIGGKEVFLLKRDQLEKYCGKEEGARLCSQLTLQKSLSGYRTVKGHELIKILENRREKSDVPTTDSPQNGETTMSNAFKFLDSEDDGDDETLDIKDVKRQQRTSILTPPPPPPPVNGRR